MRTLLIVVLLLAVSACASGRLERIEERLAALEDRVAEPPLLLPPFNLGGCIWPGLLDEDMPIIPSIWPRDQIE